MCANPAEWYKLVEMRLNNSLVGLNEPKESLARRTGPDGVES